MADVYPEQQFLETLVKAIVNKPELVSVVRTVDTKGTLLMVHVDPSDMSYVIGKHGQMAQALRIILKGMGAKANEKLNMKIYEPDESRRAHQEGRGQAYGETASFEAPVQVPAPTPAAAPSVRHGEAGLVTDEDLSDLGI